MRVVQSHPAIAIPVPSQIAKIPKTSYASTKTDREDGA
jgi:hypothetical protein